MTNYQQITGHVTESDIYMKVSTYEVTKETFNK